MPVEVAVEDTRWHNQAMFEVLANTQMYKINENKMVSPVASYYNIQAQQFSIPNSAEAVHPILQYKMNAKQIQMLPV